MKLRNLMSRRAFENRLRAGLV